MNDAGLQTPVPIAFLFLEGHFELVVHHNTLITTLMTTWSKIKIQPSEDDGDYSRL
jgi:hypothetical protein